MRKSKKQNQPKSENEVDSLNKSTELFFNEQVLPTNKVDLPAIKQSDAELKKLLLFNTEKLVTEKFTDKYLDKESEKRFLLEYREHNPVRKYLVNQVKPYMKKFPMEFYRQIYRLHDWPINEKTIYNRPGIVGKWTNDIIYCRFPEGILQTIQAKNPYTPEGHRLFKHFQFLTEIGEEKLNQFINEAIETMKVSRYWNEFKKLHAQKYKLPFQADLFDK
jgi:hypothetical protein